MSLVKCKECANEVSTTAPTCPKCGAIIKKKKGFLIYIGLGFICLIVFSMMCSSFSDYLKRAQQARQSAVAAIEVSAEKLYADYKANEVAADEKYKGKILEVSGIVDTIGKDILDHPYVTFKVGQYEIMGVQCMFPNSYLSKLAELKKGQHISVTGMCGGKLGNVLINVN